MKNMTALISLFARAYHFEKSTSPVFADSAAARLLSDSEKKQISESLASGVSFFCPDFSGSKAKALRRIVNEQLAPSVVARSAFCEKALENFVNRGGRQYLIFASGYDTYACRNSVIGLKVYELDKAEMIEDKKKRIKAAGFDLTAEYIACDFTAPGWAEELKNSSYNFKKSSFCSLLGISYYLSANDFCGMLGSICSFISPGSEIVFDYQTAEDSNVTDKNEKLAKAAGEEMRGRYSYKELEKLLEECGFLIYEHLDSREMTERFFAHNNEMTAPVGVAYVLAVKRH